MKQDIQVTGRTMVKKHLMPEVVRTVQSPILFNLLLILVMEVLNSAIGSSFYRYFKTSTLKTKGSICPEIFWDLSYNQL